MSASFGVAERALVQSREAVSRSQYKRADVVILCPALDATANGGMLGGRGMLPDPDGVIRCSGRTRSSVSAVPRSAST